MADFVPKIALDYIKNKKLTPAFSYKDVWHEEHAAGFTVAKALQLDVLSDLHKSVINAVEHGQSFDTFKKNLKPLLQQKGWWGRKEMTDPLTGKTVNAQLGSDRRLKTIYSVNMRGAYQKEQYDQTMKSAVHPYLMYRIGPSVNHRKDHASWDGLILPKTDPWWDSHLPPNGWGCKCYTRAVTEARLAKYKQQGVPVPPAADGTGGGTLQVKTEAPPVKYSTYINERKGTVEQVPEGVDPAFNWNQGKAGTTAAARKLAESKKNYEAAAAAKPKTIEQQFAGLDVLDVSMRGMTQEAQQEVLDTLSLIYSQIPKTKGAVTSVRINNRLKQTTLAQCHSWLGKIELNGKHYKNISALKKTYQECVDSGFHPIGTDYLAIFTHEAGHALTGFIAKRLGLTMNAFSDKLQADVLKELGLSQKDIYDNLSEYGKKNPMEFIAEGFAEFIHSKSPRPIAKKVGEKLIAFLGGI